MTRWKTWLLGKWPRQRVAKGVEGLNTRWAKVKAHPAAQRVGRGVHPVVQRLKGWAQTAWQRGAQWVALAMHVRRAARAESSAETKQTPTAERRSKYGLFLQKVAAAFKTFFSPVMWVWSGLKAVFYFTLGKYTPPPLFKWIFRLPSLVVDEVVALSRYWYRKSARSFWIGFPLVLVATVAAVLLIIWMPQRNEIELHLSGPGEPSFEEGAKPDELRIYAYSSLARLEQAGKPVTHGITLSPELPGVWLWVDDSTLVFKPEPGVHWAVGEDYTVKFDRDLFPEHVHPSSYKLTFSTPPFKGAIKEFFLYQDPNDGKINKVVGTIRFNYPVDEEDFRDRVTLKLKGKGGLFSGFGGGVDYQVTFNKTHTEAYVHSVPLVIPEEEKTAVMVVSSGARSSWGGSSLESSLEDSVRVPGLEDFFKIAETTVTLVDNEQNESEQVLVVETTSGVGPDELSKNLEVYLLPVNRPAFQGMPEVKNYYWGDTAMIGTEVLAQSQKIQPDPLPSEVAYPKVHAFRVQADPGRSFYLQVKKGTQGYGGFPLVRAYDRVIRVPDFPKEVKIMQKGSLLSLGGEHKISVAARDIPAVRFEIGRVKITDIAHLVSQTGGKFNSPEFQHYNFDETNISQQTVVTRPLQKGRPGLPQYASLDFSPYLGGAGNLRGLFLVRARGWDTAHSRPAGGSDSRLVLVTDMGILVKTTQDNRHDLWVMSIRSGNPVAGAHVEVLGKNGLPVISDDTDASGRASFPSLEHFTREKYPTVFLVTRGNDVAFMPFRGFDTQLDFSRFDVGGEHTVRDSEYTVRTYGGENGEDTPQEKPQNDPSKGLDAYLFSDRGIYRPGDTFHVGIIVKPQDWRQGLPAIPLEVVVTDPRGLEVKKEQIRLSPSGFEEMAYSTQPVSLTGAYQTSLYVVKDGKRHNMLGNVSARVEEFLPDTMRIAAHLSSERAVGWVPPKKLKGLVTLSNLYGTAAVNRRVTGVIRLSPGLPDFKDYPGYLFQDPLKAKNEFREPLGETQTDTKGDASFDLNLDRFADATYRLTFMADGFEAEGGRSVSASTSVLVSPLPYILGYKPDGDFGYVKRGAARQVRLIALNAGLKPVSADALTAQVVEHRFVSALTKQNDGTYRYQSVKKEIPGPVKPLAILGEGSDQPLETERPGEFELVVKNKAGLELARIPYTVVGAGDISRDMEKTAELQIKLNKGDYSAGEDIELAIRAPYVGAGLITIERDKVYAAKWFKTTTTSSMQTIRVPEGLEGNAYISVAFVRDISSSDVFMSPLSYGVMPFTLSRRARTNEITLDVPPLVRPGEPLRVGYAAQRPGRIVVYAVDEGILQVARYSTPSPLDHFFRKRALETSTSQVLDQILPEFSKLHLTRTGGDEDDMAAAARAKGNLNPFSRTEEKPAAFWSGVLDADATRREVTFPIPDSFNGDIRVMAVAVAPQAVGVSRKNLLVRGHFVITPHAPTFAAPGDTFDVSVTVANNVEGSGAKAALTLTAQATGPIQMEGKDTREMQVTEGREETQTFRIKAGAKPGPASLVFTATMGEKTSRRAATFSIRPAMPYQTLVEAGSVTSGRREVKITRKMHSQPRVLEASVSSVPLVLAQGLGQYLKNYSYGCTEQLVSRGMPYLVLKDTPGFGYNPAQGEKPLQELMATLQARQNEEGGFGMWAANSHVSDTQTAYALLFLTEARERGQPVSSGMMERGMNYLRQVASQKTRSLNQAREQAFAMYVLSRNGMRMTSQLDTLHDALRDDIKGDWETDLTGILMAASYQMLMDAEQGESLISKSKVGDRVKAAYEFYYDDLTRDAMLVYVLARHFPKRMERLDAEDLIRLTGPVTQGRYNTLSSALTILALEAYAKRSQAKLGQVQVLQLAKGVETPLALPEGMFPKVSFGGEVQAIRIQAQGKLPAFYQVTQGGFDITPATEEIKEGLEVYQEFRDPLGQTVTSARQGDELQVVVNMRAVDGYVSNVALVDILPGGFEVQLNSLPVPKTYGSRSSESEEEGGEEAVFDRQDALLPFPEYVDAREDRVLAFGGVGEKMVTLTFKVRVTTPGSFVLPPVYAEGMYDRKVRALIPGGRFEVTPAK
ncbi:MAG: alpha-2-macroglobulin family protein [Deltaproteobacteria bacterium]|nr:alpha-2-macroglobulin family protein [Deltaproteobacteria bacterium]